MAEAIKERAERLHQMVLTIREHMADASRYYLEIGGLLWLIRKEKLFRGYGGYVQHMYEFIEEIGLRKSTAYNMMDIYEVFNKTLEKKTILPDYSRLVELLPLVGKDDPEEVKEELVEQAVRLPPQGFKNSIREGKGKVTTDACEHPVAEQEDWWRCKICGAWRRRM